MVRPIPADVARVLDVFRELGDAARRALWVSERRTEHEVREAAARARALERAAQAPTNLRKE